MAWRCLGATKLVVELWEVCIALLWVWGLLVENRIDVGGRSERYRVERNPVLCGHLNGDVDIFVVLKSPYFQSSCSCSYLARVSHGYLRLLFIYLLLACAYLSYCCLYLY
jgi:hypothetical protein